MNKHIPIPAPINKPTITQRLTVSVSLEVVVFIPLRLSTKYLIIPAIKAPTVIVKTATGKILPSVFPKWYAVIIMPVTMPPKIQLTKTII